MEDKNKENSDKEVRKKLSIVFLSKNGLFGRTCG